MFLRRVNDPDPISRWRNEVERLFESFVAEAPAFGPFARREARAFPAMNSWQDDHNLYAEAEIPGLKMDDVEVLVVGNELTVKGERKPLKQPGLVYHRQERGTGAFGRSIRLPVDIDAGKVEAHLQDGVLKVTLPKAEAAKPRKVEVKALTK